MSFQHQFMARERPPFLVWSEQDLVAFAKLNSHWRVELVRSSKVRRGFGGEIINAATRFVRRRS